MLETSDILAVYPADIKVRCKFASLLFLHFQPSQFLLLLLVSLLNVGVFATLADFPTVYSGGPTADDIQDVPFVPAVADLPAFTVKKG